MTTQGTSTTPALAAGETVKIRAHHQSLKKLGHWTTARSYDVRASKSLVCLDLLLPELEPGDIEIALDLDRSTLKLLVPAGTVIEHEDVRRVGGGRVKDWTGTASQTGRVVRLSGEMRRSEVRVHRGGIAIVGLVLAGHWRDIRDAERAGRLHDDA